MQCVWSAVPFLGSQVHDKMACLKPHPAPVADPNLAKKQQQHQQQQFKRKRTNTSDSSSQLKRQKGDGTRQATFKQHQAPNKPVVVEHHDKPIVTPSTPVEIPSTVAVAPSEKQFVQVPAVSNVVEDVSQPSAPASTPATTAAPAAPAAQVETAMDAAAETGATRTRVHERIEANLNLQILLKHDELRLIDQELAKCQIALEQLRRCKVIPFPGQPGASSSFDITAATGPSIKPAAGLSRPSHMAPFGVTDGPYSRHYAQWLIPDPTFDPSPPRPPRLSTTAQAMQGRPARGSYDSLTSATTPRSARGLMPTQHSTLQNSFSVPRDRHAPLTVPRPSDGKLVKMVCKVCGKKDSANVQGFTNHCRIAHGINYASHSEAIVDCGQLVGNDEAHAYVPPTPSEPKPASTVNALPQPTGRPLVHPMITASSVNKESNKPLFGNAPPPTHSSSSSSAEVNIGSVASQEQFVNAPGNPHLSALLKKRGFNGDLTSLVTLSKEKINLDEVESLIPDEDDSQQTDSQHSTASTPHRPVNKPKSRRNNMAVSGVRIPGREHPGPLKLQIKTGSTTAHGSASGTAQSSAVSTPLTAVATAQQALNSKSFSSDANLGLGTSRTDFGHGSFMEVDGPEQMRSPEDSGTPGSSVNLSPHTVDTNPGLVTDNEDDVDYVDSEQEDRESVDAKFDENSNVDVSVKVHEEDGHHADEIMRHLDYASESTGKPLPSVQQPPIANRSKDPSTEASVPKKRGRPRKNP